MSGLLYRVGAACARHGWRVVAVWLAVLTVMGVAVASGTTRTADDFSLPGTEAFDALDRLGVAFPGSDGTSAQVVFAAPAGQSISAGKDRGAVAEAVTALAAAPQVVAVDDPFTTGAVSPDGRIAYTTIRYAVAVDGIEPQARAALDAVAERARAAGLVVEVGGEAAVAPAEIGLTSEIVGMAVALLVLLVTFGALVAAGLPLLTALVGIGIGMFGILLVGRAVDLSSTAPVLALMIGLAVGVDYALFVVSRHRHQVAAGMPVPESIARATATAGGAVVFAGLTVVVALAGLSLIGIPFLTVMGLAAAATVLVAVLIAVTLLPGLLGLLGHRIGAFRVRRRPLPVPPRDATAGLRWVRLVTARPVVTLLLGVAVLGVLALPLASLRLGLPGSESATTERSDRRAYDLIADGFGPGANGPLVVLVEADDAYAVAAAATSELATIPGVAAAVPPTVAPGGRAALLTVVPTTGPADEATSDLVERIRDRAEGLERRYDASVSVTGTTAANIDLSRTLLSALPVFVLVVVALALILLTLAFRSVVVTVKAILGFLLTIAATGGAVVAVFQWGWGAGALGVDQVGPILNFLPILLIGILFGLAMDYELFLVSRMREECLRGHDARRAVHLGFAHGARVVTAAALIMTAVFAGFFLADDPIIKSIGFALTVGVLIDAFVVRMTLVPAAMSLLAERAWTLPGWLDRILPHLDIDGDLPERPATGTARPVPVGGDHPAGSPDQAEAARAG